MSEQDGPSPNVYYNEHEMSKTSWCAEAFTIPYYETSEASPPSDTQLSITPLPPPNFTQMESFEFSL